MTINSHVMRAIAGSELDKIFPGLAPGPRAELVTSVVRQWLTNDGWAGVFTVAVNYWLHLKEEKGKAMAGVMAHRSDMLPILKKWLINPDELPALVHQLTLSQSATFVNKRGVTVRVSADPKEHSFSFGESQDEL